MKINAYYLTFASLLLSIAFVCGDYKILPLDEHRENTGNSEFCLYTVDECPNEHIQFWLYNNKSQDGLLLNTQNLSRHTFEPRLPLKILIHGFNGSRHMAPNREIIPVFLKMGTVHVISVDYHSLVRVLCYFPWAVFNANVVSKCLAQLIDKFVVEDIFERELIHIIGFSLGGQIAGLTANHAKTRLKRITALDPARPAFITLNNDEKLDPSDADFVDVIHTDPLLYGMLLPSGHADFYPNFGATAQAGCSYWQDGRLRNCNHFRAPLYYAESITSDTGFWAYNCGSWWEFLMQRCNNYGHIPLTKMGYFVNENATGSYFLTTHTMPPFAKGIPIEFQSEVFLDQNNYHILLHFNHSQKVKK